VDDAAFMESLRSYRRGELVRGCRHVTAVMVDWD
jgi:hypothetical protein